MRNLWLLSLLIYGTQAMAAAPAAEKPAPAVKQHKHHCVGKDGKPCHLSHPVKAAASAGADVKTPVSKEANPVEANDVKPAILKAVPDAAPVAAVVPAAAPKVGVSTEVALALAKQNNCLACHAIDRKVVCPAWRDVANKYRGDAGAEARLVNKIAKGGSGVWGSMAMPAHPHISEADRTTLARFVLNLH
ncbi:MAG: c-type cytochrome [Gallionella sp.]|jgi:cytochrome c